MTSTFKAGVATQKPSQAKQITECKLDKSDLNLGFLLEQDKMEWWGLRVIWRTLALLKGEPQLSSCLLLKWKNVVLELLALSNF